MPWSWLGIFAEDFFATAAAVDSTRSGGVDGAVAGDWSSGGVGRRAVGPRVGERCGDAAEAAAAGAAPGGLTFVAYVPAMLPEGK